MRKIRIVEHISLDGVIEHAGNYTYGDWSGPFRSPAGLQMLLEEYGTNFDLVIGRRTYDAWVDFWPKAGSHPMANGMNSATKHVATHRPDSLEWGPVKDLGTDIVAGVRSLKSTDGPDLLILGSSTLTSVLLDQGLVDEVILLVYPVLLGQGKRLFSHSFDARELAFVDSKATPTGVLINTYKHVGSLKK
ncbi:dihydrofolate reductase family protein [Mucilaginibacter lappiensis]|uniref:Dihydrofolate reductase n=1 Tax=Mucilaginibacter lappiensis TaxID=354630 RepID=A0A841JRK1_9SPHI|nr:dihydrofolate reductase family protein [Mucilaginibacter lappiensis]MBB6130915.1 dihydrofolate reductase [Mucilaginibacter lappiensis]